MYCTYVLYSSRYMPVDESPVTASFNDKKSKTVGMTDQLVKIYL